MYGRCATVLFFGCAFLSRRASSSLITITEHVSACSAVYTRGSSSITVVQSTVTLEPTQWTDADANSGTPFVLQVSTSSVTRKRQPPGSAWLTSEGRTTLDGSKATHYQIINGQLRSIEGDYISVYNGVANAPFELYDEVLPISTAFAVTQGVLGWENAEFQNGTANFYETPANVVDGAYVYAMFRDPHQLGSDWAPLTLMALPGMFTNLRKELS
jgi:hypothetical protein